MNQDKSKSRVRDILKQKYNPEQWKAEQEQKERETAELLAFVEGIKAALSASEEIEKKKNADSILFRSDPTSPCGFRPKGK
ncbi:hypothetical protein D3C85_1284490 [compost metagenome]